MSLKEFAAFAFAGLLARPTLAAESPVRLAWHAPAACPSEAAFRREVAAFSGRAAAPERTPPITVSVVVSQLEGGTWQAHVSTVAEGRRGERLVSDARCEDVSHAVALIVALTINPGAETAASEPRGISLAEHHSPRIGAGLDALASSGTVPGLGWAAQGRLAVELTSLALELRVAGFLPEQQQLAAAPRARMEIVAAELGLAACYGEAFALRIGLQGCGGMNIDWIHAASSGVTQPGSAAGIWPSPFVEAVVRLAFSEHGGLRLAAQAGRALQAPRFAVAGDGTFFRPAAFTFRLGVGAELHF